MLGFGYARIPDVTDLRRTTTDHLVDTNKKRGKNPPLLLFYVN